MAVLSGRETIQTNLGPQMRTWEGGEGKKPCNTMRNVFRPCRRHRSSTVDGAPGAGQAHPCRAGDGGGTDLGGEARSRGNVPVRCAAAGT